MVSSLLNKIRFVVWWPLYLKLYLFLLPYATLLPYIMRLTYFSTPCISTLSRWAVLIGPHNSALSAVVHLQICNRWPGELRGSRNLPNILSFQFHVFYLLSHSSSGAEPKIDLDSGVLLLSLKDLTLLCGVLILHHFGVN